MLRLLVLNFLFMFFVWIFEVRKKACITLHFTNFTTAFINNGHERQLWKFSLLLVLQCPQPFVSLFFYIKRLFIEPLECAFFLFLFFFLVEEIGPIFIEELHSVLDVRSESALDYFIYLFVFFSHWNLLLSLSFFRHAPVINVVYVLFVINPDYFLGFVLKNLIILVWEILILQVFLWNLRGNFITIWKWFAYLISEP